MSTLTELTRKLKEIFQVDRADLDFGIYRILNSRNHEISDYLEYRLPNKVKTAFSGSNQTQINDWQQELNQLKETLQAAGVNPDTAPKVQELQNKIRATAQNGNHGEAAVFSHLLNFFSRYYDEGDFISQRRYKGDTYAIPYNGEEVKLYWANQDQYYTKSGENFSNYRFKLDDGREVLFRLTAADTAKDNRKDNDTKRLFILAQTRTVERTDDDGEMYEEQLQTVSESADGQILEIRFEYQAAEKSVKQDVQNRETLNVLREMLPESWQAVWQKMPTEANPERTLLEKHLSDYTQKNSADYFIHKDLGGFLRRELDFYIKNEVMQLDNIQNAETFAAIEQNLQQIQVIRSIALELIDFLTQLEDFQKKLWLKKKFVAGCHYLVTLNYVPETLLPEVLDNECQLVQWKKLFNINVLEFVCGGGGKPFSEQFPHLVVDTSLFPPRFQAALLSQLSDTHDIDDITDGVLIHSDNFQALNLLQARYKEQVKCIYIDPPFNLGVNGDFLYKTNYLDSSWSALLHNRIGLSEELLSDNGVFFCRCDYHGNHLIRHILNEIFHGNFRNEIFVNRIFKNKNENFIKALPFVLDYLNVYSKTEKFYYINPFKKLKQIREEYWRHMNDSAGQGSAKIFFGLKLEPPIGKHWKFSQEKIENKIKDRELKMFCTKCGYSHAENNVFTCPQCGANQNNWNPKYLVKATDTKILDTNWSDISGYSSTTGFSTENAEVLLKRIVQISSNERDFIMDFFLGSGTTASVALQTNRKFIGVEVAEHFDSIVIHRICKTIFNNSISNKIVKVFRLESYEDALNNLELKQQNDLFRLPETAREDYLLRYMLDVESKNSLLKTDDFKNPFDYRLNLATDSAGAYEAVNIDLVETFNYLIGLHVSRITDEREKRGFVLVEGSLPSGESCLVVWRDCERVDYETADKMLSKMGINPRSTQYDVIYINGDHNIATVWQSDDGSDTQMLKLRPIEPEFLRLMFGEDE